MAIFIGFDEVHGYKNYDLFEALAPDPTRPDTLTWITSYDTIWNSPGIPLFHPEEERKEGSDRGCCSAGTPATTARNWSPQLAASFRATSKTRPS
jgi:hypothetical protein